MIDTGNKLAEVFRDVHTHKEVTGIIIRHLTSKRDVRYEALKTLNLRNSRNILDLGCGFGFFTRALKGKIPAGSRVTGIDRYPEYQQLYLESCEETGIPGNFLGDGVCSIREIPDNTIDLVICSYAMYFFPWIVPDVIKKMKKDGHFVIITHAIPHMQEFTDYVRHFLRKRNVEVSGELPYEKLIGFFSSRNAMNFLNPCFHEVIRKKYRSCLLFKVKDFDDFVSYFQFKHRFFIPEHVNIDMEEKLLKSVRTDMQKGKKFRITKDDMIFICSRPKKLPRYD
ncbi:MAG: class I SAM-dependent methyltransferase [Bacteroidales bacterium]|nr:class I SAM-dependent methyltransferase [Bacteroidales bacterium]MCF8387151.1 class I SAM-dependent methyltransferase [Bacteroidales bacterium]MCF8397635.1 class I SAM-dependent methyltransferase [Bacteroidales bacterium]